MVHRAAAHTAAKDEAETGDADTAEPSARAGAEGTGAGDTYNRCPGEEAPAKTGDVNGYDYGEGGEGRERGTEGDRAALLSHAGTTRSTARARRHRRINASPRTPRRPH